MLNDALRTLTQTGAIVVDILQQLDAINALSTARHGSHCLSIDWHNGPYSKGWPLNRHTKVETPDNCSGHDLMAVERLKITLAEAELDFFKASRALSKVMAGSPAFRALELYPAFRFEIAAVGGSASMGVMAESPSSTWGGTLDYYFSEDWGLFCSTLHELHTLEGIGTGKEWIIGKETDSVMDRHSKRYSETDIIIAETPQAAMTWGKLVSFPTSIKRAQKIVVLEQHTPAVTLKRRGPRSAWPSVKADNLDYIDSPF